MLLLYRSIEPLKDMGGLSNAVIAQNNVSSSFTDYPLPGVAYYYAVVDADALSRGEVALIPDVNATSAPVYVPLSETDAGRITKAPRQMPLPRILLQSLLPVGAGERPAPSPLSADAADCLSDIARKTPQRPEKSPRVFAEDLEPPENGEEYALRSIIQGDFSAHNWLRAVDLLAAFLTLPRSAASETKARFYLGQAYYFLNQPDKALFEFLAVKNAYPDDAYIWTQTCLSVIRNQ
jgi:hypothetical protein